MSKLEWDKTGERLYHLGVDHGVVFPMVKGKYTTGAPWNGLTAVNESPDGADPNDIYADNMKYLGLVGAEKFGATVEAYTYPDEFAECDGSVELVKGATIGQQNRKVFGMVYRTVIGNDVDGNEHGYKLHLIYGATAAPSEKAYNTINEDPEAITFSWELSTTPVNVTGHKPTASLTIDSTKADPTKLAELEKILFGDTETEPRLPLPDEIAQLLNVA